MDIVYLSMLGALAGVTWLFLVLCDRVKDR